MQKIVLCNDGFHMSSFLNIMTSISSVVTQLFTVWWTLALSHPDKSSWHINVLFSIRPCGDVNSYHHQLAACHDELAGTCWGVKSCQALCWTQSVWETTLSQAWENWGEIKLLKVSDVIKKKREKSSCSVCTYLLGSKF